MSNPRPVDACLLDADVVELMAAAFPSMELDEVAAFEDIMHRFSTHRKNQSCVSVELASWMWLKICCLLKECGHFS